MVELYQLVSRRANGVPFLPGLPTVVVEVVMALVLNGNAPCVHISGSVISDLRFADDNDIALLSESEYNLQYLINKVDEVSSSMG